MFSNLNVLKRVSVPLLALVTFLTSAHATPIFSEDFESNLGAWTGKNYGAHQGVIVNDPLNSNNQVLSFNGLNSAGDIFSLATITSTTGWFTIMFDYMGDPSRGGVANDLGGFIGIAAGFPGNHQWVAGTGSYPVPIDLVDDGVWRTYTLTFQSTIGNTVRFMLEDYSQSGGVAGDVFFDNIVFGDSDVVQIPEPSVWALFLVVAGVVLYRRRSVV